MDAGASVLLRRIAQITDAEPSREALASSAAGGRRVTYRELWTAVEQLAVRLRERGLEPGDRVALILGNQIEAAFAWYATWLAGGVVVPLNAQARAPDFARWLAHAEARFVVFEAGNADVLAALATMPSPPARVLVENAGFTLPEERLPSASPSPEGLAVVLYTSGTTGHPKGVMLSHENLTTNVDGIVRYLALTPADSTVTVLPFYYSYGASVLHTHLTTGARLVIEPNLVFPHVVVETIAKEKVSGFSGVPSTFALMLSRVKLEKYDLGSLRYLTQAGGGMPPALTQRVRAAFPDARLFVMYGQTEATARLTYLPPERLDEKLGGVGIPVPGVTIEVRREDGSRAGVRETGHVHARGKSIMLGFWKDPEQTARVLRDGWLDTGDMGFLDADGFLFLAGRRSDMIKTGAHRIHPAELEEVIHELEGIAEVAVVGVEDEVLGQAIKAFVVPKTSIEPHVIKAHCQKRLAVYKIPKFIELVTSLPKTASGKVQRAVLAKKNAPEESS